MGARRRTNLALGLLASAACALLAGLVLLPLDPEAPPDGLALEGLTTSVFLALVAVAIAALGRSRVADRLGLGPGRLSLRALVLVVVGFLALSHALESLLRLLDLRDAGALAELDARLEHLTPGQFGRVLLGVGIAPGVGEELFFRGLLQRGLEPLVGGFAAVVLAAGAFGLLHLDPIHGGAAFALGLYLGVAARWAGSTRVPIACHVINNVLAVAEAAVGVAPMAVSPLVLAAGLGVAALGLRAAQRGARRARREGADRGAGEECADAGSTRTETRGADEG